MSSKLIKVFLIFALNFMAQSAFSTTLRSTDALSVLAAPTQVENAETNTTDRYALPPSKTQIESCRREALRLHPGMIEKQRLLHRHGNFLIRLQVQTSDGLDWFMLCDLASGRIIDEF